MSYDRFFSKSHGPTSHDVMSLLNELHRVLDPVSVMCNVRPGPDHQKAHDVIDHDIEVIREAIASDKTLTPRM